MRVFPLGSLVVVAVASALCSGALAQDPVPATREEILEHARAHAISRLLSRLKAAWPKPGPDWEATLKQSGLNEDLAAFVRANAQKWGRFKDHADGSIEICLTVPKASISLFYSARSESAPDQLKYWLQAESRRFLKPEAPFLEVCGAAYPHAVSWRLHPPPSQPWSGFDDRTVASVSKAAGADALSELWKRVSALQIEDGVFVGTFIDSAEEARIELARAVEPWIDRGLLTLRYLQGGTCECDLFLDLGDLEEAIESVAARRRLPPGNPFRDVNLERLKRSNGGKRMLAATGRSRTPAGRKSDDPEWAGVTLCVTGEGPVPDHAESQEAAASLAAAAAKKSAVERMWEKILALKKPSGRTIDQVVTDPVRSNSLRSLMESELRQTGKGIPMGGNVYEIRMEIPLARVWDLVKDWE